MTTDELVRELENLNVLEAIELVKKLEQRWGVSSIRKISKLFTPLPPEVPEEKDYFDVMLVDCGVRKIEVIKIIRNLIAGIDLKDAKDLAETRNSFILKEVNRESAEQAADLLEKAGATVRLI